MTVQEFAQKVQQAEQASIIKAGLGCEANLKNTETSIKCKTKWTYVDVGYSGKYMIDKSGNIYGIKGYGVPHMGYQYGSLEDPSPKCFVGRYG